MTTLHSFKVRSITGETVDLSEYENKVALIVNVASKCGYTSQYEGLEALYTDYKERGFTVLAFPCNQFGNQEPGNSVDILTFCSTVYKVSFPLFEKIDVNGRHADPLYNWLKEEKNGVLGTKAIKWNFTKFLVGRDGHVLKRYGSSTTPDELRADIEQALN